MYYGILPVLEATTADYVEVEYMGYSVLACKVEQGFLLQRVYSTDPNDFLNDKLQPGILLENSLISKIN